MNNISKVSEITYSDLAEYIRLDELTQDDISTLNNFLGIAKKKIKNYTGRDDLDEFQDFVFVVLILVEDLWDNRSLYDKDNGINNVNKVVETILGMHSVNLL